MSRNLIVDQLIKGAVNRCRERVNRAQKKVEGVMKARGSPDEEKAESFTSTLKRSRGL